MAMEWTRADVLRVMKNNIDADGKVDMPAVRNSFNLSSGAKALYFEECLAAMERNGLIKYEGSHAVQLLYY